MVTKRDTTISSLITGPRQYKAKLVLYAFYKHCGKLYWEGLWGVRSGKEGSKLLLALQRKGSKNIKSI